MESFLNDLRYAARTLWARPGFLGTAVVTLALGIGGSTAIFSLASAVLLGRLPFRDPDRLFMVWEDASELGFPRNHIGPKSYAAFSTQSQAFEDMAALADQGLTLTGEGEPEKIEARRVTASFFRMLGVTPLRGRVFRPEEDVPGANHVVVLSHGLWQRRFGRDPEVVGRDLLLNGEKYSAVGVMPPSFQFMESYVGMWVPAGFTSEELTRGSRYLRVIARVKDGVSPERAQADLRTVATRLEKDASESTRVRAGFGSFRPYLLPLREQIMGDARRPLLVLVLAIASVLLITCANVAGLLLARAASRGREIAVRMAIGATRGRLARQLLSEAVMLAVLGALPGILVAVWTLSWLEQLIPPALALSVRPTLDARALATALLVSIATGLLFGLAPALHAVRNDPGESLRQGGRGSTGAGHGKLRSALVVAEFAATFILLIGAGLLGQTLYRMRYADLGLQASVRTSS
jgi:predicted permease